VIVWLVVIGRFLRANAWREAEADATIDGGVPPLADLGA
jgi:hypothetical protein